jgi:hypothetical protein
VKERKGPFGLMVGGIVDSVVQTARRRAQDREPRALIYDAAGRPRLLKQGEAGRDELVETGGRLIELVGVTAANGDDPDAGDAGDPDPDDLAAAEAETQAQAKRAGADEEPGETPV